MKGTIPTLEGTELAGRRYRITKRLPGGGMADVYQAWDNNLETEVIIKVPQAELLKQPTFAARFSREVRSLVCLAHPHVVKVLDVGDQAGLPFAVMQFLTGGSLRDRQIGADNNIRPLPPVQLASWLPGISQALDFIHSQKFVHRDVKPANILFDQHGNPFLSDFGVVKAIAAEGETALAANLTRCGTVMGTLQYLAPEMFLGQNFDGRIDQYALAVCVYEILSARWPFSGSSPADVMMQQATGQPAPLTELVRDVPPALAQAVARALARDPAHRFPDCKAFAEMVMEAVRITPTLAVPQAGVPTSSQQVPARSGAVRHDCPMCQEVIGVPAAAAGKRVVCPICQARLFLSADCRSLIAAPEDVPLPPPAPPPFPDIAPPLPPPVPVMSPPLPSGPAAPLTFEFKLPDEARLGPTTYTLPLEGSPTADAIQGLGPAGWLGGSPVSRFAPASSPLPFPSASAAWVPAPAPGGKGLKVAALLLVSLLLLGGLGYGGLIAYRYLIDQPDSKPTIVKQPDGKGPVSPAKSKEFLVAADGSAPYRTIQKAVENAPAGTIIRIRPGIYKERLVLAKSLTLQGEGKAADIVIESEEGSCVTVKADSVSLRGLSLRARGTPQQGAFALDITQGRPEALDCDLSSTSQAGVRIAGEKTDPLLRGCTIHDCAGTGVLVADKAQGRFEGCTFAGNAGFAVDLQGEANPLLRKCTFRNGKAGGVLVRQASKGTLEDCEFQDNGGIGLMVQERGGPTLKRCRILNNRGKAVVVTSRGQGLLEDVVIQGTAETGIIIEGGGNPMLRGCTIRQGKGAGVVVAKEGGGTLEECTFEDNALAGVELREGCQPVLRDCTFRNGLGAGLLCKDRAGGTLEKCKFEGNAGPQVEILGLADPTLVSCKLGEGKTSGVFAHDEGKGTLRDCEIRGQRSNGVVLGTGANPKFLTCPIHDNGGGGVWVYSNGRGSFDTCPIYSNKLAGVTILSGGDPSLVNCSIREGSKGGVWVYLKGRGSFQDCHITGNTLVGVEIGEEGDPTLTHCTIANGKSLGVSIYSAGKGTFSGCDINGNEKSGAKIYKASPLLTHCRIHDNRDAGIWFLESGGQVEDCDFFGNKTTSVWIEGEGQPHLKACKMHDEQSAGVFLTRNARPVFVDCDIYRHPYSGMVIGDGADPTLQKCSVHGCKGNGVFIAKKGQGKLEDCRVYDNVMAGIAIQEEGSHVTLRRCRVYQGKSDGIFVGGGAGALIVNCTIQENVNLGIQVALKGSVKVKGGTIQANQAGLLIRNQGKATVLDCKVSDNSLHGVVLTEQSSVTLRDCTLTGNKGWGVWVRSQSSAQVDLCDGRGNGTGAWLKEKNNGCSLKGRNTKPGVNE